MTDELDFVAIHSSGRYDRRLRTVKKATRFYRKAREASIVTHTEMTDNDRVYAFRDIKNWGFNRSRQDSGADDPVIEWKQSVWDLENEDTICLSNMRFRREGGSMSGATWAAKSILTHSDVRLAVWAFHLPQYDIDSRREVADDAISTLLDDVRRELKLDKRLNVLLRGDYNLNYRNGERRILEQKFTPVGLKCNWEHRVPKTGGTFNQQLICMDWHNMKCSNSWLLPDDVSSDHRPFGSEYLAFA